MSITVESLLADAKYLVNRLKDHDVAAESIAEQAATLKKEMEARNTYQENLIELNKVAGHRARSTLVLGIQQENCAIRSLQQENDELRQSLTDHQNALELIMTKYRQQMMKFTKHQELQIPGSEYRAERQYQEENRELMEKIREMAAIMRQAADIDDQAYCKGYEEISRLKTENEILRELLMISSSSYGAKLFQSSAAESSLNNETIDPSQDCSEKSNETEDSGDQGENP